MVKATFFSLLSLNPEQRIEAFYLAGGDHYHRINPQNNLPDTIQKMEDNLMNACYRGNNNFHSVSAVFIERGGEGSDRLRHSFRCIFCLRCLLKHRQP